MSASGPNLLRWYRSSTLSASEKSEIFRLLHDKTDACSVLTGHDLVFGAGMFYLRAAEVLVELATCGALVLNTPVECPKCRETINTPVLRCPECDVDFLDTRDALAHRLGWRVVGAKEYSLKKGRP